MARIIIRIDITPQAAKQLDQIRERFGCTQLVMISRLVEWYAKLPEELRHSMTGLLASAPGTTKAILRHMEEGKG